MRKVHSDDGEDQVVIFFPAKITAFGRDFCFKVLNPEGRQSRLQCRWDGGKLR